MIKDFDYWKASEEVYKKPDYSEFKVTPVFNIELERSKLRMIDELRDKRETERLARIKAFEEEQRIELDQGKLRGVNKLDPILAKARRLEIFKSLGGTKRPIESYYKEETKQTLLQKIKQFLKKSWESANF